MAIENQKTRMDLVLEALPTIEEFQAASGAGFEVGTVRTLVAVMGSNKDTVGRNLLRLEEQGRAHIHTHTTGYPQRAVWVAGMGISKVLTPMTQEERCKAKSESTKRSALRRKERDKAGIKAGNQNLTPVLEKQRTMRTVESARAAPRTWLTQLTELQSHAEITGSLLSEPQRRRGQGKEQGA